MQKMQGARREKHVNAAMMDLEMHKKVSLRERSDARDAP